MTGRFPIRPLASGLAVLAAAALLIGIAGTDPLDGLWRLVVGALGDRYGVGETLTLAVPVALIGLAAAPALRTGVIPVGIDGQLMIGAAAATAAGLAIGPVSTLPAWSFGFLAGAAGGAAWALIVVLLRLRFGVSEILGGLLTNYVAVQALLWLLRGAIGGESSGPTPHSPPLPGPALLPVLLDGTRLHAGALLVPLAALVLAWWGRTGAALVWDIRLETPILSRRLGLGEARVIVTALLAGGAGAGIAGWVQVAGTGGILYPGVGNGVGFIGLLAALLGGMRPLGVAAAALFFGAIAAGADGLQVDTGIPATLATVIEGLLMLAVAIGLGRRPGRVEG